MVNFRILNEGLLSMKKVIGFILAALFSTTSIAKHHIYFSIDCGGMLGIIPAALLDGIEEGTGQRIHALATGMIGTSTGAIISTLLSFPAKDRLKPYSAAEVLTFYEGDKAKRIFEAAATNMIAPFVGGRADYAEARRIFKMEVDGIFGGLVFSDTLIDLSILAHNQKSKKTHIFDSKIDKDTLVSDIVLASASIANAFGPTSIQVGSDSMDFIDAASIGVNTPVCDPTAHLYQKLKNSLPADDTAIIYSLGTGFSPTSTATRKLKADPNRIQIIRIQPDISHLADDILTMNLLAGSTSKKAIDALLDVAEDLKTSKEYKQMLSDLQTTVIEHSEL
jgi:patatin-like phospholipase/acyl hydrolase